MALRRLLQNLIPILFCIIIDDKIIKRANELKEKLNNEYLSIDLGVDNLMTCVDTKNNKSFIIDGKHFKWMNQYFNKVLVLPVKLSKFCRQL